jgi:hypothetical protein
MKDSKLLMIDKIPNSGGYIVRDGDGSALYATQSLKAALGFVSDKMVPPEVSCEADLDEAKPKAPAITIRHAPGTYIVCDENDRRLYLTDNIEAAFDFIRKHFPPFARFAPTAGATPVQSASEPVWPPGIARPPIPR